MKTKDLRTMKREELMQRVVELRDDYYRLQEAVRLGKERNHARLSRLKRDVAQALSILRENV